MGKRVLFEFCVVFIARCAALESPMATGKADVKAEAAKDCAHSNGARTRRRDCCRRCLVAFAALPVLLGVAWEALRVRGDEVTLICEASAWFRVSVVSLQLGTEARIRKYVQACKESFPTLGTNVQQRLKSNLHNGRLEAALPVPSQCPPVCNKVASWEADPLTCGGEPFMKLDEFGPEAKKAWTKAGLTPLRLPTVNAKEIKTMWKLGKVAKFDATSLLPKRLFNISIAKLAEMHADTAEDTTYWAQAAYGDIPQKGSHLAFTGTGTCEPWLFWLREKVREWGYTSPKTRLLRLFVYPWLLQLSGRCHPQPKLSTIAKLAPRFEQKKYGFTVLSTLNNSAATKRFNKIRVANKAVGSSNLHVVDLPKYWQGFDMAKAIDIKSQVVGVHNYLWLGASGGSLHHDLQDNILIQLTGTVEGVVVPQNCSGLILNTPFTQWPHVPLDYPEPSISQKEFSKRAPWFHFHLKAGEGIIVPSHTPHRFLSATNERVGVNAFFEPKFQQMQHTPYNYYNMVNDDILAVRILFLKSQHLMYQRHKQVVSQHTSKLIFT